MGAGEAGWGEAKVFCVYDTHNHYHFNFVMVSFSLINNLKCPKQFTLLFSTHMKISGLMHYLY